MSGGGLKRKMQRMVNLVADSPVQRKSHSAVLTPSDAADRLGIKPAMLRRHAASYEATFGVLPRDGRGARQYPIEAIRRLQHASDLYRSGVVSSVADGLDVVRDPAVIKTTEIEVPGSTIDQLVRQLLTEVQTLNAGESAPALRERVIELQGQVIDLERRNRALIGEIQRLQEDLRVKDRQSWWQRITGSTATDV